MSTYAKSGLQPTTQPDPLLRFLFQEQERLGISNGRLARMSGVSPRCITRYRHPGSTGGKTPPLTHARQLAHALGFTFPDKLEKS